MSKIARIGLIATAAVMLFANPARAFDSHANAGNNIIFLDDPNGGVCSLSVGTSALPPTTAKLSDQEKKKIEDLKSVYQDASVITKVPWQIYAAIDYRESGNNPNSSILDGNPLGDPSTDSPNRPTTKIGSILDPRAGDFILKENAKVYGIDPTQSLTFEQLQKLFVAYNRYNAYLLANQSPDSSPYVMNKYDDAHKDMRFPNIPGETLAGNSDANFGAMAVFATLSTDPGEACSLGTGVGAKVDYSSLFQIDERGNPHALIPAGTLSPSLLCTPRPSQPSFQLLIGPACDSFIALDGAYQRRFNTPIPVGQGFRTADEQKRCGGYEDENGFHPGSNPRCIRYNSNTYPPEHLWGTAIDFKDELSNSGTEQHTWLVENGPLLGWFWPNWAREGHGGEGGYFEPWHFGYYFVGHDPTKDLLEAYK